MIVPGFLLDTNVVSELISAAADQRVLRWIASQSPVRLHLSSITLGELVRGVARLPESRHRRTLERNQIGLMSPLTLPSPPANTGGRGLRRVGAASAAPYPPAGPKPFGAAKARSWVSDCL
ncbi:MAG: PIN domain-containing protein [Rhodospirillales bacterium]|nr:PIN domain-containing protein [Rhodospirillales bacterium]